MAQCVRYHSHTTEYFKCYVVYPECRKIVYSNCYRTVCVSTCQYPNKVVSEVCLGPERSGRLGSWPHFDSEQQAIRYLMNRLEEESSRLNKIIESFKERLIIK